MRPYPSEERFRQVFDQIEAYIERRFGIPVVISDVTDPFTGDLDGAQILVDYDQPAEDALFIIAHLLGHTVQWNTEPQARFIGTAPVSNPTEEVLADLRAYELTACRYSLQLFHDAGVRDLDQWMADFAACDSAYLMHFYRTGSASCGWRNEQRELALAHSTPGLCCHLLFNRVNAVPRSG